MFLHVSAKNPEKGDTFVIQCDGKRRVVDSFSTNTSFDCGEAVNCHAAVEYLPQNTMMKLSGWIFFILKEIITSILFFLVFDKGRWFENISPFKIKKKVIFKPSSPETGELSFEFKNSSFDVVKCQYIFPVLSIETNGVILTQEVGYLPNIGGIRLGYIHYLFQILTPSAILLALCIYAGVYAVLDMNTVLIILLALSSVVILTFVIVMLVRGRKTRHEVEDLVYSQLRSKKK